MRIIFLTQIDNGEICKLAARMGAVLLPRARTAIVQELLPEIQKCVYTADMGWLPPEAMVFFDGSLYAGLSWLQDEGNRTRKAIIVVNEEVEKGSFAEKAINKYASGVILVTEGKVSDGLKVKVFTPDQDKEILDWLENGQDIEDVQDEEPEETAWSCKVLLAIPCDDEIATTDTFDACLYSCEKATEKEKGSGVFISKLPKADWNLSRARNLAVKFAEQTGYDVIGFVDADCLVSPDYVTRIKKYIKQDLNVVLVPTIVESIGEKFRPGSGVLISKTLVFKMLKGYDEGYVGGGAEDIDFIHRAMEKLGVVIVEGFAHILHQTHEVRSERLEANALNEERFRRVLAGEDVGFTSILEEKE